MSFYLLKNEPLADGVMRMIGEQLQYAATQLTDKDIQPDTAFNEVREAVAKLHVLLQLARPALKKKEFRLINKHLQQLGLQLGSSTGSLVLPDTLDQLTGHFSAMLDDTALEPVRQSIASRHSLALQHYSSALDFTGTRKKLDLLEQQFRRLKIRKLSRKTLKKGIRGAWHGCRQALATLRASPTTENSHTFRRQIKTLWYQLRLLRKQKHLKALRHTDTLLNIEQLLGQDNNLSVLIDTLHEHPEITGNPVCRELLISLAETRRIVLLSSALRLAKPVFAGKPGVFTG